MEPNDHPAFAEERSWLANTISRLKREGAKIQETSKMKFFWGSPGSYEVQRNAQIERLRKCKDALRNLYFGRVDWKNLRGDEAEHYYIGITEFTPYIIAWQDTLAADLYYNRSTTREKGDLLLVRTLQIKNQKISDIEDNFLDPSITGELAPDSLLAKILTESRGQLQNIVATINKQQFAIIRAPLSEAMIIQGAPGTGKTVIALHRLAYLLYNNKKLRGQNLLFLGPNPIYLQYVSHVLPSLGEREIPQLTTDQWVTKRLGENLTFQSQEELLEFWQTSDSLSSEKLQQIRNCRNMGSLQIGKLLERYVDFLRDEFFEGKDSLTCSFRPPRTSTKSIKVIRSREQVREIFETAEVRELPLNKQREIVEEKLLKDITTEIIRESSGQFRGSDNITKASLKKVKAQVHEYFNNWHINAAVAYRQLFRKRDLLHQFGAELFSRWDLELMSINAPTVQESFRFSDQAGLFYFKLLLDGTEKLSYGHIMVDEAQDISPLFFQGLSQFAPNKSITILGDISQGVFLNNGISGWEDLFTIFPTLNKKIEKLSVCYRSTWQIMQYANGVLTRAGVKKGDLIQPLNRIGEPVSLHPCDTDEGLIDEIIAGVKSGLAAKWKSIAIICKNAHECQIIDSLLKKGKFTKFELITNREQGYSSQVVLLPAYLAKGLEFDIVILADGQNYLADDLSLRLLFVAITRPAHKLHICWLGQISPLLDEKQKRVKVGSFFSEWDARSNMTVECYAQEHQLDPDRCIEMISRSGWLPLLSEGQVDPVVMDLAVQSKKSTRSIEETKIEIINPNGEILNNPLFKTQDIKGWERPLGAKRDNKRTFTARRLRTLVIRLATKGYIGKEGIDDQTILSGLTGTHLASFQTALPQLREIGILQTEGEENLGRLFLNPQHLNDVQDLINRDITPIWEPIVFEEVQIKKTRMRRTHK
jgi:DNA helicase-2/ATP-dependent DNA helicase PcrA